MSKKKTLIALSDFPGTEEELLEILQEDPETLFEEKMGWVKIGTDTGTEHFKYNLFEESGLVIEMARDYDDLYKWFNPELIDHEEA